MPAEVFYTFMVGFFLMLMGYFVWNKKALFLINLVLWNGLWGDETIVSRIFGAILFLVGLGIVSLPFLFQIK